MNKFARGSEWRKWDLHAHTAIDKNWEEKVDLSSAEAKRKFAKDYIACAVQQGLSAIAITDHNFCDDLKECLIPYIQKEAYKKNIVVFPGFEITANDGSGIHLLVIFPEDTSLKIICDVVKHCFPVGTSLVSKTVPGSNKSIFEIKQIINEAQLDSLFIFAHADSTSGILDSKTITGQRRIEEWHNPKVQIAQISKPLNDNSWGAFYKSIYNKTNPKFKREMAYIMASDCRRITKSNPSDRNCLGDKYTWIKGDLTFEGLKQIIREPNERIYLGEEPQKLRAITLNKTKYIDTLEIYSEGIDEKWFEEKIELNFELISIIGNKGSGKSALSDIIGLLGNSYNYNNFSFLKREKFYKVKSAKNYKAKLLWKNQCNETQTNETAEVLLTDETKKENIEKVRYIPQNYFEQICNLTDEQDGFKKEIEKVIFNHLKEEDRLNAKDFRELITIKKESIQKELYRLKTELDYLIEDYVTYENTLSTSNINLNRSKFEELTKQKQDIETELKNLTEPTKPADMTSNAKLTDLNTKIKEQEEKIIKFRDDLLLVTKNEQTCHDILSQLDTFNSQYNFFKENLNENLKNLRIKFNDIVELKLNKIPIIETKTQLLEQKEKIVNQISTIKKSVNELKNEKKLEEDKLSGEFKLYQEYVNKKQQLEKRLNEILGNKTNLLETKDTFYYYENLCSIEHLESLRKQKAKLCWKIKKYSGQIFDKLLEVKTVYQSLRNGVEEHIKEFDEISKANIQISFNTDIKIKKNDFESKIMSYVAKRGEFYGENRERTLNTVFYNTSLNNKRDFLKMCSSFINLITDNEEKTIGNSLQPNDLANWKALYKYLFSLDYIDIGYELKFNDKTISMLSPGERGLLLLIFFLLADKSNNPLILDQPEENLDNQTIYSVLVPMIKHAKKKRQVIMVTHNPNLAVVCDSEQIIYSEFNSQSVPKIKYTMGSIENPEINKKLVNILEGTMIAFRIRDKKYIE